MKRLSAVFSFALACFGTVLALATASPAQAQYGRQGNGYGGYGGNSVTCESWNYQPAACSVPGIVDVQIARIIAGDCNGRNWNLGRDSIQVRGGCRAVFQYQIGGRGGNYGGGYGGGNQGGFAGVIKCESWQFRPARCNAPTRGGVQLQRVIAGDCREGQTWGWDRNGIWVNGGCRAEFILAGGGFGYGGGQNGGYGGGYGGAGVIITCDSWNYQPARCAAAVRGGVIIDRVQGGNCVEGQTWGWDRSGIWVEGGCRARFRVY